MNLFLMPMWFLSGALFPPSGAFRALRWLMHVNPLTYGLSALRGALYGEVSPNLGLPGFGLSVLVTVLFAAAMLGVTSRIAGATVAADLQ